MKKEIFVVGRRLSQSDPCVWELLGVFDDKNFAIDICYDDDCFILTNIYLNEFFGKETKVGEGFYPLIEKEK